MEETCPYCRHVVSLPPEGEDRPVRCGNCRAILPRPQARLPGAAPATSPIPAPPASPAPATTSQADGLGIASLILGMVFFVPVLPQVLAIGLGAASLLRRPSAYPRRQRSAAAWAGLVLGLFFLLVWGYLGVRLVTLSRAARTMPMTPFIVAPYATSAADDLQEQVRSQSIHSALDQVSAAIRRYRTDYRHWPRRMEDLASFYLPDSVGVLLIPEDRNSTPELWMVANVDTDADPQNRIVVYSVPVRFDLEGEALPSPHRWVLRLDGRLELVPANEVERAVPGFSGTP